MITINSLTDLIRRMLPCLEENTESLAEGASYGGTGKVEDIPEPEVVAQVTYERELIDEAKQLLELFDAQCANPPPGYFNNDYYTG